MICTFSSVGNIRSGGRPPFVGNEVGDMLLCHGGFGVEYS